MFGAGSNCRCLRRGRSGSGMGGETRGRGRAGGVAEVGGLSIPPTIDPGEAKHTVTRGAKGKRASLVGFADP